MVPTETQSITIHDVQFFNTELAMHYGAILKMVVCCHVLAHVPHDKSKTASE